MKKDLWEYYDKKAIISLYTEKNSLIITDRADKIFFPQRKVVSFMMNYDIFKDLPAVVKNIPVYYYTLMPQKDIDYINENKIKEYNLKFVEPKVVDSQFRLYRLIFVEQ